MSADIVWNRVILILTVDHTISWFLHLELLEGHNAAIIDNSDSLPSLLIWH